MPIVGSAWQPVEKRPVVAGRDFNVQRCECGGSRNGCDLARRCGRGLRWSWWWGAGGGVVWLLAVEHGRVAVGG